MAIRDKSYLKDKFQQGAIPTGQDFADFIETFVASINGETPDVATGDVPYIGQYNMVEPVDPFTKWDDPRYPEGLSSFITTFTEANADWLAIFGDVVPPYGNLIVLTSKSTPNGYCLQEVDAVGEGAFSPQFSRTIDSEGNWTPLRNANVIRTINGISPNLYGDLEIEVGRDGERGPEGPRGTKGDKGDKGDPGERGPQGIQGPAGVNGTNGTNGANGATGPAGERGPQGEQGPAGATGAQGERGPAGPQGPKGEMGNGFAIAKVYPSVTVMNADYSGTDVSVNEFVLINSQDDDNGKLFVKTDTEYMFQSQLAGVKGDQGEQGIQGPEGEAGPAGPRGLQGIQGVAGVKGDKGDKGDDGKGITIKGVLEDEGDLPETGLDGDAYWVEDVLYIWSSDPATAVEPSWIRGTHLRGPQGVQGIAGQKGEKGDVGPAPVKDFLYATRITTDLTLSNIGDKLVFNNRQYGNIPLNTNDGRFTLTVGKMYRITCSLSLSFGGTADWAQIGLFNSSDVRVPNLSGAVFVNHRDVGYNQASNGPLDLVYTPNVTSNFYIALIARSGTVYMRNGWSSLIVQEL